MSFIECVLILRGKLAYPKCAAIAVSLLIILAVVLWHAQILRTVTGTLVIHEHPPDQVEAVLLGNADGVLESAASWIQRGSARRIILVADPPSRSVALGILTPAVTAYRTKLQKLGIDNEAITTLPSNGYAGSWAEVHVLNDWLEQNPDEEVVYLCANFDTRRLRIAIDRVLSEDHAANVVIFGLPSQQFDEQNWWLTRAGWKSTFDSLVNLAYDWWCGEDDSSEPTWDPEEYEAQLRGLEQEPIPTES
jgi:hypothetical protein